MRNRGFIPGKPLLRIQARQQDQVRSWTLAQLLVKLLVVYEVGKLLGHLLFVEFAGVLE